MQILNYTPHDITIVNDKGIITHTIKSSGIIRLKTITIPHKTINGIKITKTVYGSPDDIPAYKPDTYLIVSQLVKRALENSRNDLLVPTEMVRDSNSSILGCKSLGV